MILSRPSAESVGVMSIPRQTLVRAYSPITSFMPESASEVKLYAASHVFPKATTETRVEFSGRSSTKSLAASARFSATSETASVQSRRRTMSESFPPVCLTYSALTPGVRTNANMSDSRTAAIIIFLLFTVN